ncbi:MAG: PQQ-binding-like beta-propeller repeat protein [Gemmataceae bacterium]|nr:PQQ-binding-like beta-propeller repeat protein [Gemmataceae bacterium]
MRRLFAVVLLFGVGSAGAMPPSRVLTFPPTPSLPALDRLNLDMAWKLRMPVESRHDGIALIQQIGDQYYVQLRNGTIYALDAKTGTIQWSRRVTNPYPVIRPLGNHPTLVLALDAYRIIGLDKKSGAQQWELTVPEVPVAPPEAGDLLLYVPLSNGRVLTYSLPETTEAILSRDAKGRQQATERIKKIRAIVDTVAGVSPTGIDPRSARGDSYGRTSSPTSFQNRGQSTEMAIRRSNIVSKDPTPDQIAAASARPLFLSSRSPGFRVDHPVLVSPVGILISGNDQQTLLLRKDVENPTFKFTATAPLAHAPTQFGNVVYFTGVDGAVQAVDLVVGIVKWQVALAALPLQKLVATDSSLYAVTDRLGVVRIDRERGTVLWNQIEARSYVAANDSFVYARDRYGNLLVLDRVTGTPLSRHDLSGFNVPFVSTKDDRIILAANDGSLMCLHDQSQTTPLAHTPATTQHKTRAEAKAAEKAAEKPVTPEEK